MNSPVQIDDREDMAVGARYGADDTSDLAIYFDDQLTVESEMYRQNRLLY